MPELVFFRRGEEVLRIVLERQRLVLGRGEDCDVVLPDPHVSRRHVALHDDGTRCLLEDLSGQGTLVAGKPMTQGELPDGVDLQLGPWLAVFRQRVGAGDADSTYRGPLTDVQSREALEQALPPAQVRVKQGTTELLHRIDAGPFTVGKDPSNALVLSDRFISNEHLRVRRSGAGFHVRDLNSTNGTFAGSLRLYEAEIPLNTVLRVGETELLFEPVPQGQPEPSFHGIVGTDPAVRQLVECIQRVAPSDAAVAILGESGTGKELVARALHACSSRAQGPFLPINCAALSPGLMESELFGHEKGAFTGADSKRKGAFEAAHGGTLFLDEVGELPLELQAKLLRVLESGELKPVGSPRPFQVDVRVVLPPLRRRRGDVRLLAEHFVRVYAPRGQRVTVTAAALGLLQQHGWPGNIRELRNVVCRALLVRQGPTIEARDITFDEEPVSAPEEPAAPELELPAGVTLEEMMQRVERQLIEGTLRRCRYNKERAARELGLARSALFKKLKRWGLTQGEE